MYRPAATIALAAAVSLLTGCVIYDEHRHERGCYEDRNGWLICPPERQAHNHSSSRYGSTYDHDRYRYGRGGYASYGYGYGYYGYPYHGYPGYGSGHGGGHHGGDAPPVTPPEPPAEPPPAPRTRPVSPVRSTPTQPRRVHQPRDREPVDIQRRPRDRDDEPPR